MAGKIKTMIDTIIDQRAKGNAAIASTTRTKLLLKGIQVDQFTASSADDPVIMDKLQSIAKEMNISLGGKF